MGKSLLGRAISQGCAPHFRFLALLFLWSLLTTSPALAAGPETLISTTGFIENGLTLGPDGNFYGVLQTGGNPGLDGVGFGSVFQITPAGVVTTLHAFSGTDGATPSTAPVFGSDGNLYGITDGGGANNMGTFYRLSTTGQFTSLLSLAGYPG